MAVPAVDLNKTLPLVVLILTNLENLPLTSILPLIFLIVVDSETLNELPLITPLVVFTFKISLLTLFKVIDAFVVLTLISFAFAFNVTFPLVKDKFIFSVRFSILEFETEISPFTDLISMFLAATLYNLVFHF